MRSVTRALVAIALSGVMGVSSAPAAARIRTRATIFRGFDARGRPTVPVRTVAGSCFTGSLAANRRDAWRCLVGNFLYDPCISAPQARGFVICPNLRVNGGIRIRLTQPLPRQLANRRAPVLANRPWNIQLVNGRHCAYSSGASNFVQGARLNYFCGGGVNYGLWGIPNRRVQPWTIRSAPFNARRLTQRRLIQRAWM